MAKPQTALPVAVPRGPDGKLLPGAVLNPGGQHKTTAEVRELARKHGPRCIERLAELLESGDGQVAIAAAKVLLERGHGKAVQRVEVAEQIPRDELEQRARAILAKREAEARAAH